MQGGKWKRSHLWLLPAAVALPGSLVFFVTWLALAIWFGKQEMAAAIWPALAGAIGFGLVALVSGLVIAAFISKSTRS